MSLEQEGQAVRITMGKVRAFVEVDGKYAGRIYPKDVWVLQVLYWVGSMNRAELAIAFRDHGWGELSRSINRLQEALPENSVSQVESDEWQDYSCVIDRTRFKSLSFEGA